VGGWYDCGKVDTLLETNEHLLRTGRGLVPPPVPGVVIREPVRIDSGVTLRDCTIGPNVTIESGSEVLGSTVERSILGRDVRLRHTQVHRSVIGDSQVIENQSVVDSVVDAGEVSQAK
jgi:glucose-1-phosphate thymidylyltransferase